MSKSYPRIASKVLLVLTLILLATSFVFATSEINPIYSDNPSTVKLEYDNLNRIINKTAGNQTFNYEYDEQYLGTLNSVTTDNYSINYEYDKKQRVKKEAVIIDGITFTKEYVYDSQDRTVKEITVNNSLDYIYNKQGKVKQIPGVVTSSSYNAIGSILNKSYNNGIVTTYTYDELTNRLKSINSNVQSLTYEYDNVGNIMSINNSNVESILKYDNLDRLILATIGADSYEYSYNSLGNIMKVNHNNNSKKYVYYKGHAPIKITEGDIGVDVHNPHELETGSKNRTFEMFLIGSGTTNFTVDFGDGQSFTENINVENGVMVFIQNNYSHGGDYVVNFSTDDDYQKINTKFGMSIFDLDVLYANATRQVFEFISYNDVVEMAESVTWNCSDGINSMFATNLTGNQFMYDYFEHNYSAPGRKTMMCNISSLDGSDSKTIEFNIPGLEIENYDVLAEDISRRIISFDVMNYFTEIQANITMDDSALVNLSHDENIMVFTEVNYSNDGYNIFDILVTGQDQQSKYIESFKTEGVSIENYNRYESNLTTNILSFDVVNNWHNGFVNWSVSEPDISNLTYLNNSDRIMVIIENNYTQGLFNPQIKAKVSSFEAILSDSFLINPLDLTLNTLSNSVTEMIIDNNIANNTQISWALDDLGGTINATDNVMMIIEGNYSTGVHQTKGVINSSKFSDIEYGVIIQ